MDIKKKIKIIYRLVLLYAALYLAGTAVFVWLFHTPLLKSLDVFMYRGIVFILISSTLSALLMWACKHFIREPELSIRDIIMLFMICCCVNTVLFTLIPVTVERSISVFMLSYMCENEKVRYTQEEIENIFIKKYVGDYGAFEKRFHEQLVTGNIGDYEDDSYGITKRGKLMVKAFRAVAELFGTDQRLLYPNEN